MKTFLNLFLTLLLCIPFAASAQNRCLHYDGNDDRVNFASPLTSAGLMNNFSVACRFKNENTINQGFLYRLFGWGTSRFEIGDQNGVLVFYTNETGTVATSATNIRDGLCHNLVATKSSNPNVVRIYLDGTLVLMQTLVNPLTLSTNGRVGDWMGGATAPSRWNGLIDDFEVFEGPLTTAQVAAHNAYLPVTQPLLLQFPFNQGVPAGVNTGLTSVVNTVGANGTAQNFAMTGPTSNWVLWPCSPQNPLTISCNNNTTGSDFITVCNTPSLCGNSSIAFAAPTITGGVPPYTVTSTAPAFFPIGITQVCYTVFDATGTSASCCFWVKVNDCENPVIFCASNVLCNTPQLCAAFLPDLTGSVGAIDNCPGVTVSQGTPVGTPIPVGLTTVLMTATDASGNTSTCLNYVQVNDCEAPIVTCPDDFTVCTEPQTCEAKVDLVDATYWDNCGIASVNTSHPIGSNTLPIGVTTISFIAYDFAGNSGTCSYTITVEDCTAPIVYCPPFVFCNDPGLCSATMPDLTFSLSSWDNCGTTSIVVNTPVGSVLPVGVSTYTATVTDASGLTSTCSNTISVQDCEAPSISCPANVTLIGIGSATGQCCAQYMPNGAVATDNCPGVTVSYAPILPCYPVGVHVITATATDAAGLTATCAYTVTVNCGAPEICNGIDDDGDGLIDEGFDNDGDGVASCFDCDDNNPFVSTSADRCLRLDGTNDRVDVPGPLTATQRNRFSISCKFQSSNTVNQNRVHVLFGSQVGSTTTNFGVGDRNGTLVFFNNNVVSPTTATNIRDSICHDVTLVKSVTTTGANQVRIYYDGVLVLTQNVPAAYNYTQYRMGGWSSMPANFRYWKGFVDEFGIYNTSLTAAQVVAQRNSFNVAHPNLVSYYPLNQGLPSGLNPGINFATDVIAPLQTGTLVGFALNGSISNWVLSPCCISSFCEPKLDCPPSLTFVTNNCFGTDVQIPAPNVVLCPGLTLSYFYNGVTGTGVLNYGFFNVGTTQVCYLLVNASGQIIKECCFTVTVIKNPTPEIPCNGIDDDCDGLIDEGNIWYADADGDSFGNPFVFVNTCTQPTGYVDNALDCDDNEATVNPNAQELCDGIDNDCDGIIDNVTVCVAPSALMVNNITPTTAILSWPAVPCATLGYRIVYKKNSAGSQWATVNLPAGQTSLALSGLSPNTSYICRVMSKCLNGVSGNTEAIFTTPSGTSTLIQNASTANEVSVSDMLLFPNPTTGKTTMQISGLSDGEVRIAVTDMFGKVFFTWATQSEDTQLTQTIDLGDLPSGVYSVQVLQGDNRIVKTIVKQ